MLHVVVERESDVPVYRRIMERLRVLIHDGSLVPGTGLPIIQYLARELHLTRLNMLIVYYR